ncbi:hypothetical protein [Brevibacillus laterosporus]|nr:hypothetical protein [Brevibacillus laterosporus]
MRGLRRASMADLPRRQGGVDEEGEAPRMPVVNLWGVISVLG